MLGDTYRAWKRIVGQTGPWTLVVWTLAFGAFFGAVIVGLGLGAVWTRLIPHTVGAFRPAPPPHLLGRFLGIIAAIGLSYLLVMPFFAGGLYGTIARAVDGDTVSWGTFWIMARRCYGRAWGLVLYGLMLGTALLIGAGIFLGLLHLLGGILLVAGLILTIPFEIRMVGGLFLQELPFGESFRRSFRGPHYGAILGGAVLGVLVMMAGLGILAALAHVMGPVVMMIYYLATLALVVAGPAWFLALYRTATPVSSPPDPPIEA